jgi:hypothetical protein
MPETANCLRICRPKFALQLETATRRAPTRSAAGLHSLLADFPGEPIHEAHNT